LSNCSHNVTVHQFIHVEHFKSLHEITNDYGVRVANFATLKNLFVKSTVFPHHIIRKYTWTLPDGETYSHIDHILTDKGQLPNTVDIQSFRGADCQTTH